MNRMMTRWMSSVVLICGVALTAHAAEQAGQPSSKPAAPAAPAVTATPWQTAEGAVSSVDLTGTAPALQLTDATGKVWTLAVDPKTTTAWKSGLPLKLEQIKAGDQARVRYTSQGGRDIARQIRIEPARSTASTVPAPTAAPAGKP